MNDDSSSKLEGDLLTAAVMQCSVSDLQASVEELQLKVCLMRRINQLSLEVLKSFIELCKELIESAAEGRSTEKIFRRIAREAARTRLPLWFWRPEEGLGIKGQLLRRARFLIDDMKYGRNDVWDHLREFTADYARVDVSEEQLIGMLKHLYERETA